MANTMSIPKAHIIMGLCLPLAVVLGYILAQPLDAGGLAVVVLVFAVLSVPLFMKWHHPLLILSWNAAANPLFLPGRPAMWMVMSLISLFFALLARSVNSNRRFIQTPSVTKPVIFLSAVVVATAMMTGGLGIRSLGSEHYGGRGYFYILCSIAGYFALTSRRIPPEKATFYVTMFFLSAFTVVLGDLAIIGGPKFTFLLYVFAPDSGAETLAAGVNASLGMARIGALPVAGAAIYGYILARYGIRGVLKLDRPWRFLLIAIGVFGCLASGFRSSFILFALTFLALFWFEGLHHTKILPILIGAAMIAGIVILPNAEKLPIMAQRTLSFIPAVPVDPIAKESAQTSTEWRVEMWKAVLPQVPRYLLKGKGYAFDPNDLYMAQQSVNHGYGVQAAGAIVAGDYHNGPLSVLIPFGIFGFFGFIWFLVASLKVLYYHYRFGAPELHRVNTFLLAAFAAKTFFFIFIFGALSGELFMFIGIIGLSIALNGPPTPSLQPETSEESLTVMPARVY
jgi:O-antigen ligase/polysaccharide polymerase Wzy-like membrane protein